MKKMQYKGKSGDVQNFCPAEGLLGDRLKICQIQSGILRGIDKEQITIIV